MRFAFNLLAKNTTTGTPQEEVMTLTTSSFLSLCAADIMSRHIVMIPRAMSLQGAARSLARAKVSGAPVVDDNGRCIGVLSTTDFMHLVEHDHDSDTKTRVTSKPISQSWQIPESSIQPCCVEDCMTKDPVLVPRGTRIGELARMMMDAHIHRLIVVDATQRPIGIVSSIDILAALARVDQTPMAAKGNQAKESLTGATY
jgi:predicted transcriptional regulator